MQIVQSRESRTAALDDHRSRVLSERAAVRTNFFKALSPRVALTIMVALFALTVWNTSRQGPAQTSNAATPFSVSASANAHEYAR